MSSVVESKGSSLTSSGQLPSVEPIFEGMASPQDPEFLKSLPDPLKSFSLSALDPLSSDLSMDALMSQLRVSVDVMVIQLRQEILRRIRQEESLDDFWKLTVLVCWHMIFISDTHQEERKKALSRVGDIRKIPILLLEDILESSTIDRAWKFYNTNVQIMSPFLFGSQLWYDSDAAEQQQQPRPCGLAFLKLANNFSRRLSWQPHKFKDAVSSIMLTLCQIYPLSEKSATRSWGSHNDQASTIFEERLDFEREQAPLLAPSNNDDEEDDGAVPDYTVYESFWKLQQDFQRPNSVHVSDFLQRLRSLLTTLEHTPLKATTTTTPGPNTPHPLDRISVITRRYLTSSRLLSIQLQDVGFRACIMTQVLIVCHHLIQMSPVLKIQFSDWLNRAHALLQKIPCGHEWLQTILATSEESWRQWKKNKCLPDLDERKSQTLIGRKRKRSALNDTMACLGHDAAPAAPASASANNQKVSRNMEDVRAVSCQMRDAAPSLQKHLEEYVEALDPESGIEAEYHPKNNALFCWRAMRLLTIKHLPDMHWLPNNGDFENVVRTVFPRDYGIEIPGEMAEIPLDEEEAFKEEEEPAVVDESAPIPTEQEEKEDSILDEGEQPIEDGPPQEDRDAEEDQDAEMEGKMPNLDDDKVKMEETDIHDDEVEDSSVPMAKDEETKPKEEEHEDDQEEGEDGEEEEEEEKMPSGKAEIAKSTSEGTKRPVTPTQEEDDAVAADRGDNAEKSPHSQPMRGRQALNETNALRRLDFVPRQRTSSNDRHRAANREDQYHRANDDQYHGRGGSWGADHSVRVSDRNTGGGGGGGGDTWREGHDRSTGDDYRAAGGRPLGGGATNSEDRPVRSNKEETTGFRKQPEDWHRDDRRSRPSSRGAGGEERFPEDRQSRPTGEEGHKEETGGTGNRSSEDRKPPAEDSRSFGTRGPSGADHRNNPHDRRGNERWSGNANDRQQRGGEDHGTSGSGRNDRRGGRGARGLSTHRGDRRQQRH